MPTGPDLSASIASELSNVFTRYPNEQGSEDHSAGTIEKRRVFRCKSRCNPQSGDAKHGTACNCINRSRSFFHTVSIFRRWSELSAILGRMSSGRNWPHTVLCNRHERTQSSEISIDSTRPARAGRNSKEGTLTQRVYGRCDIVASRTRLNVTARFRRLRRCLPHRSLTQRNRSSHKNP